MIDELINRLEETKVPESTTKVVLILEAQSSSATLLHPTIPMLCSTLILFCDDASPNDRSTTVTPRTSPYYSPSHFARVEVAEGSSSTLSIPTGSLLHLGNGSHTSLTNIAKVREYLIQAGSVLQSTLDVEKPMIMNEFQHKRDMTEEDITPLQEEILILRANEV
ncbi:hypothetical protein KP509_03G006600 [Ceratopteris richardii]|uniref:Uncharacterized protein n=1 Tax=Ceratopteris richardii TaxID=49495 RepID=A0A8T2V8Q1_CERRI|nr:hypothetical protein KP509_03G006600 [Ceratopteris richardii]